ncbi:Kinesin-like protein bimC [Rhodotorula toruloides]|nr:Kinesin-like protein bimC [Rhodotorula toruloides]
MSEPPSQHQTARDMSTHTTHGLTGGRGNPTGGEGGLFHAASAHNETAGPSSSSSSSGGGSASTGAATSGGSGSGVGQKVSDAAQGVTCLEFVHLPPTMANRRPPAGSSSALGPPLRRPASRQPPPAALSLPSSSASSSLTSPPLSASTRGGQGSRGGEAQKRENGAGDGNIQVVVRCRGVSPSEVDAQVPVVAEVKSTRGTEVKLTDPHPSLPSSSSAALSSIAPTPAQTKTWDFGDRLQEGSKEPRGTVYGPDADQGMLYTDVAKPMLQQVLMGYNCTIFAYGQTGTGKTYTMEGDLSPYHGTFHPDAGIIPRTLYSLFDRLAESRSEYSVRCSFIELYNEELRDLNAADYSLSSSDGSSAAPSPDPSGPPKTLRIYEETKNGQTGVTIQGLEETFIQSAEEGLRVLRRGSERRQIAATNCNERSSRSHSIFTIVVHIKDSSKEGQDVLKVGKLNLVDLAGSENVGRSGAVQGRAREAGMINASLLALGRVINQLVDKDPAKKQHIAYRESKLTRLLQDSLGGRTKTTIIATISPVSYEETASTLTYAHQAKSIQNRPEVNQRVSKNVMLNQFATEIERLKADLNAARGQEGVYVSKETWDEMETGRLSFDETKRKLEISESQLQTTRDQFEQNFRLLSLREEQLRKATDELGAVKGELVATSAELRETKLRLAQQEVLRDAFETSREGWKEAASGALDDVEGLRAKLDRKSDVERNNHALIVAAREAIATRAERIGECTSELRSTQQDFLGRLGEQLDAFTRRQQAHLASTLTLVDNHVDAFAAQLASLASTSQQADAQATDFRQAIDRVCAELHGRILERADRLERLQRQQADELEKRLAQHAEQTTRILGDLAGPVRQLQQDCSEALRQDQLTLEELRDHDAAALADENARLRQVVADLQQLLASEEEQAQREQEETLRRLHDQLSAAASRRSRALASTFEHVEHELEGVLSTQSAAVRLRADKLRALAASGSALDTALSTTADLCDERSRAGAEALSESLDLAAAGFDSYRSSSESERRDQLGDLQNAANLARRLGVDWHRQSTVLATSTRRNLVDLVHAAGDAFGDWKSTAKLAEGDSYQTSLAAAASVDAYSTSGYTLLGSIDEQTDALSQQAGDDLHARVRHDVPTGATPRPRERPQDRLMPGIDLDADRPSVLERLLAQRAADLAQVEVAAAAETVLAAGPTVRGRMSEAVSVRETPSPVVMRVPLPPLARPSLVTGVAGKGELFKRVKPAPLGERDANNPARRLGKRSMSALTTRLLFPLHLAVLASLHAVLASARAARLVLRLASLVPFPRLRQHEAVTPSDDLKRGRWNKLPKHLAVILAPARTASDSLQAVQDKVEQLRKLLGWSRELGIATLSVYDETGLLVEEASEVSTALGLSVERADGARKDCGLVVLRRPASAKAVAPKETLLDESWVAVSGDGDRTSSATLVNDDAPPTVEPDVQVNLLSRQAGQPWLARVAEELATGDLSKEMTSEEIAETIDSLPLTEPDLLFVFGGSYLRLHGFPPWQIRLTEMYHHSWPSWTRPPPLTYEVLRKALDLYGGAEMRFGR